jgi:hypothetical protein
VVYVIVVENDSCIFCFSLGYTSTPSTPSSTPCVLRWPPGRWWVVS